MHFFFHHRVNLAGSCTFFVTTVWTYQAHALVFTTVWTYQTHALFFSAPCELIKLMHSFFTTVWTYQTHALFFSAPCELIKLMHSFFTTVWTYQTHALPFHHRVNLSASCTLFQTAGIPTCILHMQEHCGSTEQSGRNLEILQRRKLCGTETLLGLLAWVKFQIKSIFIIHQYAKHKYYHW